MTFTTALHYLRIFNSLVEPSEVKNEWCDDTVTLTRLFASWAHSRDDVARSSREMVELDPGRGKRPQLRGEFPNSLLATWIGY